MNKVIKVKDRDDLVREPESKALLQVDRDALLNHRKKRELFKEVINNNTRIDSLENEMKDIKKLLLELLQKDKVI